MNPEPIAAYPAPPELPSTAELLESARHDPLFEEVRRWADLVGGTYAELGFVGAVYQHARPASRADTLSALLSGGAHPVRESIRTWCAKLSEEARTAATREAFAEAESLESELDSFVRERGGGGVYGVHAYAAAGNQLPVCLVQCAVRRDILGGVLCVLAEAGDETLAGMLLEGIDAQGRRAVAISPRLEASELPARLVAARVGAPDGWWTRL